jgi:outer membrane lipoprotein-sorting protein
MKLLLITLTILQSLLSTLEQKTLQSDFTITITQEQTQPMTYAGTLAMRDQKFALEFIGIEAAYDGQTLYMYSEDTEELTLSTPTEEELIQTNPFLYARALLPLCEYAEKAVGDKTQITLTPRDQSLGINKFVLRLVTTTLLPIAAEIHESEGKLTTLTLNQPVFTTECPPFTLDKPEAFINDLR